MDVSRCLRLLVLFLCACSRYAFVGASNRGSGKQRRTMVSKRTALRWAAMCVHEREPKASMMRTMIEARLDLLPSRAKVPKQRTSPSQIVADPSADAALRRENARLRAEVRRLQELRDCAKESAAIPSGFADDGVAIGQVDMPETSPLACAMDFDSLSLENCLEVFGEARTELVCPEGFMRAVIVYGQHLLSTEGLYSYDIMHEIIRAETGYRLARLQDVEMNAAVFDEFMHFQENLSSVLQGWTLWEYEFHHWIYYKRSTAHDAYAQLYETHRPPEFQHLECPSIPWAYRRWSNFPTCPPTRLRDLPRFHDAYVSGMTVDNWRSAYQNFLSEEYNYNTSIFSGGDPTMRLSKGAHSIFAGVFLQKFPTDLWCYQQVIHDTRPLYIIELGSSQGGSAVWFASILKMFRLPGKVVTVDIGQEQAYWLSNKRALAAVKRLNLEAKIDWNYVAGGSKNEGIRSKIRRLCEEGPCMVVSDSDHDYEHTFAEIEFYAGFVGVGQYLVVEDTNIYGWNGWRNINDPNVNGLRKGPMEAANDFELSHRADFVRTDWCSKQYGLSQTPNGWFFRTHKQRRSLTD